MSTGTTLGAAKPRMIAATSPGTTGGRLVKPVQRARRMRRDRGTDGRERDFRQHLLAAILVPLAVALLGLVLYQLHLI